MFNVDIHIEKNIFNSDWQTNIYKLRCKSAQYTSAKKSPAWTDNEWELGSWSELIVLIALLFVL